MSQAEPSDKPTKRCSICGKDLSGQPRVKDRDGQYYCIPCDDAEKDRLAGGRVACAECGRFFRRDKLTEHGADLVCEPCAKVRRQRYQRMRRSGMDTDQRQARKIQLIALILLILFVLVAIWLFVRAII